MDHHLFIVRNQHGFLGIAFPGVSSGAPFTPQEMNAAIAAIRKHSSAEELSQIDKILEKSRQEAKKQS